MKKGRKPTRLTNIDALAKGGGNIAIGRIGSIRWTATAADGSQSLAMLVRRPRETWPVPPYRLYYRKTETALEVIRIYHQSRRPLEG